MTIEEENIKKQLTDHLYWDNRVDASKINIDVNGKKVKLSGTVPTYQERVAAVDNAWKTSNVAAVENDIKVAFAPKYKIPSDEDLQKDLYNLYKWNPYIDEKEIKLKVKKGIVTLEGNVDAYWKKIRSEQIASNLSGIKDIDNKISVVPSESIVDEIIAKNVVNAIDRNYFVDVNSVTVKVKDGKVKLTGSVKDWVAYTASLEAAENTAGVTDVNNSLSIIE